MTPASLLAWSGSVLLACFAAACVLACVIACGAVVLALLETIGDTVRRTWRRVGPRTDAEHAVAVGRAIVRASIVEDSPATFTTPDELRPPRARARPAFVRRFPR